MPSLIYVDKKEPGLTGRADHQDVSFTAQRADHMYDKSGGNSTLNWVMVSGWPQPPRIIIYWTSSSPFSWLLPSFLLWGTLRCYVVFKSILKATMDQTCRIKDQSNRKSPVVCCPSQMQNFHICTNQPWPNPQLNFLRKKIQFSIIHYTLLQNNTILFVQLKSKLKADITLLHKRTEMSGSGNFYWFTYIASLLKGHGVCYLVLGTEFVSNQICGLRDW